MNAIHTLCFCWYVGVLFYCAQRTQAYNEYPTDSNHDNAVKYFWIDCTNGNDGTGAGSSAAPFKTINYGQNTALNAETDWEYKLIIQNGPCPEPKVVIVGGIKYSGSGTTPPKITNGMSYTSANTEQENIEISNLQIPVLNISMIASTNPYFINFMNCKIGAATVLGSSAFGTTGAQFWYSNTAFAFLSGIVNIFYGTTTIGYIGSNGLILVQGGGISGTTVMGASSQLRLIGGSAASATFSSTQTGINKPIVWYGTDTVVLPTISGVDVVNMINDCNSEHLFGSVTLTISGSAAVAFNCAMTGNYVVTLSFGSGLLSVPGTSAQTTGGFTISGSAGATIGWVATKQT